MTPLDCAAGSGRLEVARILIEEYGADPGFAHDGLSMAPIFWAIDGKHIEMVKLLLAAHADPAAEDWAGNTLHAAAWSAIAHPCCGCCSTPA